MNRYKKGTDAPTSMPRGRTSINSTSNSNTVSNISLILFGVFIVLLLVGVYIKNDFLTFFSLGLGVSISVYTLFENMEDDDE